MIPITEDELTEMARKFIVRLDKERHGEWWSNDSEELAKAMVEFSALAAAEGRG